jgi:hypothetical protein
LCVDHAQSAATRREIDENENTAYPKPCRRPKKGIARDCTPSSADDI